MILDQYESLTPELLEEIRSLASRLEGLRVVHVNSTARGGGVAEMLHWLIPTLEELGLSVEWHVLEGSDAFFRVTKKLHNALQGAEEALSDEDWDVYFNQLADEARLIPTDADLIIFHDPQTLGLTRFLEKKQPWAWRLHIDTTRAEEETLMRVLSLVQGMDLLIFTLPAYALPFKAARKPEAFIMPAIDAYSRKNRPLLEGEAEAVMAKYDLQPGFLLQVSRFDPWKGWDSVIDAWKLLRQRHALPLVMLGSAATDDPEAQEVLERVRERVKHEEGVHIITEHDYLLVNVLQRMACCVFQLSTREGFGLTVTEAMWKGKPVIGGMAEGIKAQITHGVNGFLARSAHDAALYAHELLIDPGMAERIGTKARETVREKFLLPRLVRDHLRVYERMVSG